MNRRHLLGALLMTTLAARVRTAPAQTAAQPALPKEKLVVVTRDRKRHDFTVEMALTPEQQTVGEMFRPSVPAGEGMLFDWGREQQADMWMRNTLASLDMLFIAADGTVKHIAEHAVPRSLAIISSGGPVRATLEVAAGTAEKLGIRVGDRVEQRIFGNAKS